MFPEASVKTTEGRQFSSAYLKLFSACSQSFLDDFFRAPARSVDLGVHKDKLLTLNLIKTFQDLTFSELAKEKLSSFAEGHLSVLMQNLPPMPSPRGDGWSASMDFSARILETIAEASTSSFPPHNFMSDLLTPLLRRMDKKRLPLESRKRIYELALIYAQKNDVVVRDHWFLGVSEDKSFYNYVVRAWISSPTGFQQILESTLKLVNGSKNSLPKWISRITQAPAPKRYELLRLLGIHACYPSIDIESIQSLARLQGELWPSALLCSLEQSHANKLFNNLMEASRGEPRIQRSPSNSVINFAAAPGTQDVDPYLFGLSLLDDDSMRLDHAQKKVQENRNRSIKSRDQTERAFYAESAIRYGIISGDLSLCEETLNWSRRFLKDPLTVKSLFAYNIIQSAEIITLLSVTSHLREKERSEIQEKIRHSNKIILLLLDFACTALREPSFSPGDWRSVLALFGRVTSTRLSDSEKFRLHFGLSEPEMYDLVWSDTLSMLIQAENTGIKPGHESLNFHNTLGPLEGKPMTVSDAASAKFFDELAQARNKLWVKKRALDNPSHTTLSEPWPRGLQIHHLIPFSLVDSSLKHDMPWMAGRAGAVVLMRREVAQSPVPDHETQGIIGPYSDRFTTALKLFVKLGVPTGQAQKDRISIAWSHAIDNFIAEGQSRAEFEQLWSEMFSEALGSVFDPALFTTPKVEDPHDYEVAIPEDADEDSQNEWDPAANERPFTKRKELVANLIHFIAFQDPIIKIPGEVRGGIWNIGLLPKAQRNGKNLEGLSISALIYLDTRLGGPTRILSTAFPQTTKSKRYPPLFLAVEFVDQDRNAGIDEHAAFNVLETFLTRIPPSLLLSVGQNALEVLRSGTLEPQNIIIAERILFKILRLLSRSDRPDLASDVVCDAILSLPESSSWHRQIVHRAFLKTLSHENAKDFIEEFSRRIDNLRKSQKERAKEGAGRSQVQKELFVKVTTIKMLAQLLANGDLFSIPTAISLLEQILIKNSHIDARAAALQSVFDVLPSSPATELHEDITRRIRSFLMNLKPIIGSLSERHNQETLWESSRDSNELPEIDNERPLFEVLLNVVKPFSPHSLPQIIKDTISQEVLLPAIEALISEHRKWLTHFAEKYLSGLDISSWPVITPKHRMLSEALQVFRHWLPLELFNKYNSYILFTMRAPEELKEANMRILANDDLRTSSEAEHWSSVFGDSTCGTIHDSVANTQGNRYRYWLLEPLEGEIRPVDVEKTIVELAKAILESNLSSPDSPAVWHRFVKMFKDTSETRSCLEPTFRRILRTVDELRTPEWQANINRFPARLPSTFEQHLWLLKPRLKNSHDPGEVLAQQTMAVLEQVVAQPAYYKNFEMLKRTLDDYSFEDRLAAACVLGKLPVSVVASEIALLRLELAEHQFQQCTTQTHNRSLEAKCRACVMGWSKSTLEEAREAAWKLLRIATWLRPVQDHE